MQNQTHEGVFARLDRCVTFASKLASRWTAENGGVSGRRKLDMTSADSSFSSGAFATADAGFEYLATAEHYRYLATGIVDALRRHCLVLVTGNPPANSSMLVAALREAAAPRAVIELSCGSGLDCEKLFAGGFIPPDSPAPVANGQNPNRSVPASSIFVFANADRLSDDQVEDLREAAPVMPYGPHGFEAGVLLAHSDFVTRLESAGLRLLDEGLAGHLRVQQLERDEVEAFIRHQLPRGEKANLLTAQRVALIALTSGGDPAVVNRLARRMLENEPDVSVLPPVTPRRYAASLKLLASSIICLGLVWFAVGAYKSQHLGVFVGLVRDRILPRNEQAEVPPGLGAAPSPVTAAGSSSVNIDAAPPSAASAGETVPEPVAADHPDVTSSPRSAPERAAPPVAEGPQLSAAEIANLVARGDAFLGVGDIASARLFFERAAHSGDSRAAMRMAVTYDAAFLDRVGLHGLRADPERAAFWYRRSRELAGGKAEPALGSLGTPDSAEPLPQPR
jgi:hypothetical protein